MASTLGSKLTRFGVVSTVVGAAAFIGSFLYMGLAPDPSLKLLSNAETNMKKQEGTIQALDAQIATYWTVITQTNAVRNVPVPDTPEAYCSSLPPTDGPFERLVNSLLCGPLESRVGVAAALEEQKKIADKVGKQYQYLIPHFVTIGGLALLPIGFGLVYAGIEVTSYTRPFAKQKPVNPHNRTANS